jgi:hypothetical protein
MYAGKESLRPVHDARIDLASSLGSDVITHRIPISDAKEIDAEVKKWLKAAYDRDA